MVSEEQCVEVGESPLRVEIQVADASDSTFRSDPPDTTEGGECFELSFPSFPPSQGGCTKHPETMEQPCQSDTSEDEIRRWPAKPACWPPAENASTTSTASSRRS